MEAKLLKGFPPAFIKKLEKKSFVPSKKGFVYLKASKSSTGMIGMM